MISTIFLIKVVPKKAKKKKLRNHENNATRTHPVYVINEILDFSDV